MTLPVLSYCTDPDISLDQPLPKRLESLFTRVREDDYEAFQIIFRVSYRRLCAYSKQMVSSPELAEEIVDDVFCNLWQNRKKIHIASSFQSYLNTSVRNRSLDCLRKLKREKIFQLDKAERVPCGQSIATESLVYEELRVQIERAVTRLPEQCRIIFRMSREQDLSYKEIACRLNISVKTVDTQIGRALRSVRQFMADQDRR